MSRVQTVEAVELTRSYGRRYALKKANFSLQAGTVTAIIGQNGAGKTTAFDMLAARRAPSGGEVRFDGEVVPDGPDRRRAVGYLSHASFLYGTLTARENLELVAGLYRVADPPIDPVLERVGLSRAANRQARHFSRGMVQRLALGRLLLANPDIWLLDEPASGLDEAGRTWLGREIDALMDAGRVVALSSHSRSLVGALASHVVVLKRGRVVHTGPVDGPDHIDALFREHIG